MVSLWNLPHADAACPVVLARALSKGLTAFTKAPLFTKTVEAENLCIAVSISLGLALQNLF